MPDGTRRQRECFTCGSQETTSWYKVPQGQFNCIRYSELIVDAIRKIELKIENRHQNIL
jgi:hypothetical protein